MRRGFLTTCLVVLGLYFSLHLVLGSSPVQARVLAEIRAALAKYGLDLQMESIEFSALSPKIYLNRVTLTAGPKAPIQISEPLQVDKIKISFQPFALIYRQISVDELALFHPKIRIDDASALAAKVDRLLSSKKGVRMQGGSFSVVFKKIGVVDALMAIDASEPQFSFRTRGLSAYLEKNSGDQQSIRVESNNIEIARGPFALALTKVDVDIDATKRSLRVNRAILESDAFALNAKGVSSLPFVKGKGPDSTNLSYEISLNLPFLEKVQGLVRHEKRQSAGKIRTVAGRLVSSGSIRKAGTALSGEGNFRYDGVNFDGYRIGHGGFSYTLGNEKLNLTNVALGYAGGEIKSSKLVLGLKDSFPLNGDVTLHNLAMEGILDGVKVTPSPVRMGIDGMASVSGTLNEPFVLRADTNAGFRNLIVLQNRRKPVSPENTILTIDKGGINGLLTFTTEKFAWDAKVKGLGSEMKADGFVGFGPDPSFVRVKGEGLSLTELGHIAELKIGGMATLAAAVDVKGDGSDVKVAGSFDVQNGVVADIVLGPVKGETFYQNDLLSFENLEIPAIESIRGSGFVDFKPVETHYKFTGEAKRVEVDQAFSVFQNVKLAFQAPKGGEVASRFTIEGGHDRRGIEVVASGQAKDFLWYGERWVSSNFNIRYRMNDVDVSRLLLIKKSGAVEIKGHFDDKKPVISFLSRGLRLEELDYLKGSLVQGEVLGQIGFEGTKDSLFQNGNGQLRLTKTAFRGAPLPDTAMSLHTVGESLELLGQVSGDRLRGRFWRGAGADELTLSFREFDFTPLVTLVMGKDIPSITQLTATGNWAINGDFSKFNSLKGNGSFSGLDLGFKGTPMRNRQAVELKLDNGKLRVPRFELEGADSQLSMEVAYEPQKKISASADAKLDLQILQPFIPGLDYGTGKVSMGLRVSGSPDRYELLGNARLEDGVFRLNGLLDEFRQTNGQFTISHDRINIDRFETTVNGGSFEAEGDIRLNRFTTFTPNLRLHADRVALKLQKSLVTRFSGDFTLRGSQIPYQLAGNCRVVEGNLTEFSAGGREPSAIADKPVLNFDLTCEAKDRLFVNTEIMTGEFRGNFHVLGNSTKIGLLGNAEAIRGTLIFKDTRFNLTNGVVKFESPTEIAPRFSVSGVARVKEQKLSRINVANADTTDRPQEYDVNLLVYGTPADYKLRLSSSPSLAENDIISLLVLGVTGKGGEGSYADLGSALVGQIPLQSKLQNEFGLDIRIKSQAPTELQQLYQNQQSSSSGAGGITGRGDITVPSVQIRKEITKKTRVSFSNTLEATPSQELKLEQLLDENLSVNATVEKTSIDKSTNTQSYGLDVRYRFNFE